MPRKTCRLALYLTSLIALSWLGEAKGQQAPPQSDCQPVELAGGQLLAPIRGDSLPDCVENQEAPQSGSAQVNTLLDLTPRAESESSSELGLFATPEISTSPPTFCEQFKDWWRPNWDLLKDDFKNYYSLQNLCWIGLGVAVAAPLANTDADASIRGWYKRNVTTESLDPYSHSLNYATWFWIVLPAGIEMTAMLGHAPDDYQFDGGWREWSNRSIRSTLVATPLLLSLYGILGASRPNHNDSAWHPFQDFHGVSGHTTLGAIPFLTAASMMEDSFWQYPMIVGSLAVGWSRIHDDEHYFSQVVLGWWLAYWAVSCVDDTQVRHKCWTLVPVVSPEGTGIGLSIRY